MPAGRPKDKQPRVHLHMMVLPKTNRSIRKAVNKKDKKNNTIGKIVDGLSNFVDP